MENAVSERQSRVGGARRRCKGRPCLRPLIYAARSSDASLR